MAQLRDIATIRTSGEERNPETVEDRAKLVWTAVHRQIREAVDKGSPVAAPYVHKEIKGYFWQGALLRIIRELWPMFHSLDWKQKEAFRAPIYDHLRDSGNAVCINRSRYGSSSWFISEEWRKPITSEELDPNLLVEHRWWESPEGHRYDLSGLEKRAELVLRVLWNAHPEPVVVREVLAGITNLSGQKPHESTIRPLMVRMVERGLMFSRQESPDERAIRAGRDKISASQAFLYSLQNPVPARTKREVVEGYVFESGHDPDHMKKLSARQKAESDKQRRVDQEDVLNAILTGHQTVAEIAKTTLLVETRVTELAMELLKLDLIKDLRQSPNHPHRFVPVDYDPATAPEEKKEVTVPKVYSVDAKRPTITAVTPKLFLTWMRDAVVNGEQDGGGWVSVEYLRNRANQSTRAGVIRVGKTLVEQGLIEMQLPGGQHPYKFRVIEAKEAPEKPVDVVPNGSAPGVAESRPVPAVAGLGAAFEDFVSRAVAGAMEAKEAEFAAKRAELEERIVKLEQEKNAVVQTSAAKDAALKKAREALAALAEVDGK